LTHTATTATYTLSLHDALPISNGPMKLAVRFIRLQNPDEPTPGKQSGTGIHLYVTNSCSPACTSTLIFGTGAGGTSGLDLLYGRSEEHTSELQSQSNLVCRLLL